MAHFKISKGLDIPIKGKPSGNVQQLTPGGGSSSLKYNLISLDLKPFDDIKFKLLVKPGDVVKIGQPIAEDKSTSGRMFCSPAGGVVQEIRRGLKRVLHDVVISVADKEEILQHERINIAQANRQQIIDALKGGGLFANIRSRPFNLLANPEKTPRSIFVKAVESAPFVPPAELQVAGHESEFQEGLNALAKLTDGNVNLIYKADTSCRAFTEAKSVQRHTAEGPHPIGTYSLYIQALDPIETYDDNVWTLNAHDVVSIGHLLTKGQYFTDRVVSIAGPGVLPDRIGYFRGRSGMSVADLVSGRIEHGELRFISGDPLMGSKVDVGDFLGYYHYAFCVVPENSERELLHFFRLGVDKYSFSKAYVSGHLNNTDREYEFTTNQHGEHRAFVDATLYDEVMPLPISTMLLVKAVMAEDFELADKLGLLSVDSEDFALPTFVCPSKMEMTDIIKTGLKQYSLEALA